MALRHGKLCAKCGGGKCVDPPTPSSPYEMVMPGGVGRFEIDSCPVRMITPDTAVVARLAWFAKRGILWEGGGLGEQVNQLVEGMELAMMDTAEYEDEIRAKSFGMIQEV